MAEIMPTQIGANLLAGMQGAQQLRDARQMNQLRTMQMQQTQDEIGREKSFRDAFSTYMQGGTNALAAMYAADPAKTMQVQQFQTQQNKFAMDQRVEQAKQAHAQAEAVLASDAPADYFRILFPDKAEMLAKQLGKSADELSDEDATTLAQRVSAVAAGQAGITPEFTDPEAAQINGQDQFVQFDKRSGKPRVLSGATPRPQKENGGFTLGEGQTRFDAQGRPIAAVTKAEDAMKRDQALFERANTLRDEYDTQSKEFQATTQAYQRILSATQSPSAAGDMALIFSFMRALDPGSTVREGEFANAENAGGVPDRVRAQYNKLLRGERLTDDMRTDFVQQAGRLYQGQKDLDEKRREKYLRLAERAGLNPNDVIGDRVALDVPASVLAPGQSTQLGGFTVRRKK